MVSVALLAAAATASADAAAAPLGAHGSVRQVYAVGGRPGQRLMLLNPRGLAVAVAISESDQQPRP